MTRSRLLLGVASALAGTTVLLFVFGLVYNPILLLSAVPFAAATFLIWSHATGRMEARMRGRAGRGYAERDGYGASPAGRTSTVGGGGAGRRWSGSGAERDGPADGRPSGPGVGETPSRSAAASVLGVDPGDDEATVRRAFREKARELHPDAPGGDEAEFRRVRAAYERLVGRQ